RHGVHRRLRVDRARSLGRGRGRRRRTRQRLRRCRAAADARAPRQEAALTPAWFRDARDRNETRRRRGRRTARRRRTERRTTVTSGKSQIVSRTTGDATMPLTIGNRGPRAYDRTADGERFVFFTQTGAGGFSQHIQVVLNWTEALKTRVPTK